jgi:soluble lytic murein transglycosylase-like protein
MEEFDDIEESVEWDAESYDWVDWEGPEQIQFGLGAWPKFLFISTIAACTLLAVFLSMMTAQASFDGTSTALESPSLQADLQSAQQPLSAPSHQVQASVNTADSSEVECQVSEKYPHSIRQWCGLITRNANKRSLNPDLVAALIWQESGGNPAAYSKSGAVGLMQVMPRDGLAASFMCVNGPCFASRPSSQELSDPEFNVSYGTKMLAGLVGKHGNIRDALKSYGPMDVGYYYADKVMGIYQRYGN